MISKTGTYNLYDSHLHLNKSNLNNSSFVTYKSQLLGGNLIVNDLNEFDYYLKEINNNFCLTCILDFHKSENIEILLERIVNKQVKAIKLHPRVQCIAEDDYINVSNALEIIPDNIPVIYDAWYFGSNMKIQPNLSLIIDIIKQFENKIFILAHMGGYKLIEYFTHTRNLQNVKYDLSLTPSYFYGTSIFLDLIHFVKWTDPARLMYGTDYPSVDTLKHYEYVEEIFTRAQLTNNDIDHILRTTFTNTFSISHDL